MDLFLKATFTPLGRTGVAIDIHPTNPYQEFIIDDIKVCIYPGKKHILAFSKLDVDHEVIKYFEDEKKEVPRNSDYENLKLPLYRTVKDILKYLKYLYGITELDENLNVDQSYEWSTDNKHWVNVPDKRETAWRPTKPVYTLDDNLLSWFPKLISKKMEPFFAFTHLHKAFAEKNTRHQWINATIAAELAFKEFLSQIDKKTNTLMTYVPSPPIKRLYRDVLKDYTGEESPMYSILEKGATKRNALIHNPEEAAPSVEDTYIYMHQVEVAIFHLYTCLYKNDSFFAYLFNLSKERLEQAKKLQMPLQSRR